MTKPQKLLTTEEAAEYLGNKPQTLAIWRGRGTGPEYIKGRTSVRYTVEAVVEWGTGTLAVKQRIEETAPCHVERRLKSPRLRGRAWAALRARQLSKEPYCRDCADAGQERAAEQVDHILALDDGGTNDDHNLRSLCVPCHAKRTKERLKKNR
jgi:5-methylcytosine-specific restriction protein A